MSRYHEPPTYPIAVGSPTVFLAGGITDVEDWQAPATETLLEEHPTITVFNPRRADFPIEDPSAGFGQVAWEQHWLHKVDLTLFWFPKSAPGRPQPIAQFELGQALGERRRIVVGAEYGYPRVADVRWLCHLNRPDLTVHDSLDATVKAALHTIGETP